MKSKGKIENKNSDHPMILSHIGQRGSVALKEDFMNQPSLSCASRDAFSRRATILITGVWRTPVFGMIGNMPSRAQSEMVRFERPETSAYCSYVIYGALSTI
jgi:hypothetical protein